MGHRGPLPCWARAGAVGPAGGSQHEPGLHGQEGIPFLCQGPWRRPYKGLRGELCSAARAGAWGVRLLDGPPAWWALRGSRAARGRAWVEAAGPPTQRGPHSLGCSPSPPPRPAAPRPLLGAAPGAGAAAAGLGRCHGGCGCPCDNKLR